MNPIETLVITSMIAMCFGMYFWLGLDWWMDRRKAIARKHDRLTGTSALVRASTPSRGSLPSEVLKRERQAAMWRDERRARKAAQHEDWTRQFLDLVQPFQPVPIIDRGTNVVRTITNDDGDTIELRSWNKYRTNNEERLTQILEAAYDRGPYYTQSDL